MTKHQFMRVYSTLVLILSSISVFSQDPEFSQFYANPIYTNPALAGTGEGCGGRISMSARNQWTGISRPYETFSAAFDRQVNALAGGIAVLATHDVQGIGALTTQTVSAIYSNLIMLNSKWHLRTGVQATFVQRSIDFSRLTFSDQIEPRVGFMYKTGEVLPTNSIFFPNFSAGAIAYSDHFFVGGAVHNLIEPNQSFYRSTAPGSFINRRYTFHSGANFKLKNRRGAFVLSPRVLMMVQGNSGQINLGAYLSKNKFTSGIFWRQTFANADALMVMAGYQFQKLKIAYSFDFTVSSLRVAAQGAHELSLIMELPCRKSNPTKKYILCPFSQF